MKKKIVTFMIMTSMISAATGVGPVYGQGAGISKVINEAIVSANERTEKIKEAQDKMASLDTSNKMDWFTQYKEIQGEYSEWLDPDETIYDVFSTDELDFLFRIVEAEVTGEDHFQSKVNVASVIFNRLYDESEEFPNTLTEILKQPSQFSSYSDGRYNEVAVTQTTVLACEYAWQIHNSVAGSIYFDSCDGNSWASDEREYVFTDSVGHSFYR